MAHAYGLTYPSELDELMSGRLDVLGLVHEVRDEHDRGAALADPSDEVPGDPACGRVQTGGHLVEEHDLRVVNERKRDEQPLALPPERLEKAARSFSPSPHCSIRTRRSTRLRASEAKRSSASLTLMRAGSADSWSWHPIRRRRSPASLTGSNPSTRIRPPSARLSP